MREKESIMFLLMQIESPVIHTKLLNKSKNTKVKQEKKGRKYE